DEGDVRAGDGGELGDVADTARTHLEDEEAGVRSEAQHGQGQTELVVEAAGGGDRRPLGGQDRAEQVLGAGLAGAAGGGEDHEVRVLGAGALELGAGEGGERLAHIVHLHARDATVLGEQGEGGACGAGRLEIVVAVHVLAAEGGEEVTGGDVPRVDACDAGDELIPGRTAHEGPAGEGSDVPCRDLEHAQRPSSRVSVSCAPEFCVPAAPSPAPPRRPGAERSASRSRRRSSNGWTIPPICCPVSAPLPATRMVS